MRSGGAEATPSTRASTSDTPGPITWALDLLQAHGIPPLAEGEDERRCIGQLNV